MRRFQEPAPAKAGGEFKLGNGRYCFPLTVTDHASRFLLLCEALESTRENLAITAFEQLFQERGLPQAIRSDNGVPFASPNGLFNLSKLSVWWLRLGIAMERLPVLPRSSIWHGGAAARGLGGRGCKAKHLRSTRAIALRPWPAILRTAPESQVRTRLVWG